ncbi:hypothetical protein [Hydrogenophaga sp. OTU3427]|uniref:hypothetical protein n=1 Tax=Hydrogenophaga sp. OTU3427 TaxID=3043856 RepID=UPI00313E1E8C
MISFAWSLARCRYRWRVFLSLLAVVEMPPTSRAHADGAINAWMEEWQRQQEVRVMSSICSDEQ